MSIITDIKAKQLEARKARNPITSSILTTLIGEAEMVGKNAGHLTTDEQTRTVIKKFIKNNEEIIKITSAGIHLETNASKNKLARDENNILQSFLPPSLTEEQLTTTITKLLEVVIKPTNQGTIMKGLKELIGSQYDYDSALAAKIIKQQLHPND